MSDHRYSKADKRCHALTNSLCFRPFRRDFKIWRVSDVDNKFEAFLLVILTVLALLHIQAAGGVEGGDASKLEKAMDILQSVPAVSGLVLALVRHWYNWRLSKKRLAEAELEDYLYTLSGGSTSHNTDGTRRRKSSLGAPLLSKSSAVNFFSGFHRRPFC